MIIIMHRGASMVAPENTISALTEAALNDAQWVESDVCLSADDQLVIFHDDTLYRTARVKGKLCDFSLDELQRMDVGSWFSPDFSHERIPTLEQWLEVAATFGLSLNLEIKGKYHYQVCVDSLLSTIAAHWPEYLQPPLLSSFDLDILNYLSEKKGYDFPYAINLEFLLDSYPQCVHDDRCVSVHLDVNIATEESVAHFKSMGKQVYVFTVNDLALAKRLQAMGVDAIFSDNLELLSVF
jgi:glycerophosphoryl diester phosphodiesterase